MSNHRGPGHNPNQKPPAPPPTPPPPPPSGDGYDQLLALMIARFPKYDDTGALAGSQYYGFGAGIDIVRKALAAGQTPAHIASALGTIWSRYATNVVAAGPGGPGGVSHALAWGQAIGETARQTFMSVLFPSTTASKQPAPPSGPPVNPGAGPGIG